MKKRFLFSIVLVVFLTQSLWGQDFRAEFQRLFAEKDFGGMETLLKNWEKLEPNNPELYVSYFNFYFNKSREEVVTLTSEPTSDETVKLSKEGDDKAVAFLGSQVRFEKESFEKGIAYINKGIRKFPDRLDMRLGKIYAMGQVGNFQEVSNELIKLIERSDQNKNAWLWMENKRVKNPLPFMLDAIQDHIVGLFNAGPDFIENFKTVAETVLKFYPKSVKNLSNLAVYYLVRMEYKKALEPLLRAEKIAPRDYIVLNNIAFSYYSLGEKEKAIKYYELVFKYAPGELKEGAREKLLELKK